MPVRFPAFAALVLLSTLACSAADWRQFRGNDATGVARDDKAPQALDESKQAWRVDLPGRGLSGPIVVGTRVFLTASTGADQERLHVLCFSTTDGTLQWERQFWATGRTQCHQKMAVATPTPASDGQRVFAFFSCNDLACLDLEGNLLWFRGLTHDFPNASNSLGMASSPVVFGDTLVVQVESDAESFSTGVDVETGVPRWKIDRPRAANWTSPAIVKGSSGPLALLQSSEGITVVEPRSGKVAWKYGEGASTIPSSAVVGDLVVAPSNGLTAIRGGSDGKAEIVWKSAKLSPGTPSPLVVDGRIFTVNRAGALACASLKDGEVLWQARLKGPFSSTPVAAAGHVYFVNEEGLVQVVKPGAESGEIVSDHALGETVLCTPAVAGGAFYVRSDKHLWKFADR
jgi:outer membrane protein assembly factor BamB